jgi:hypothetical protein
MIKSNGVVSQCHFSNDWVPKSAVVPPPALVDLACATATKPPVELVRNHNNEPVDASDGATVRFSLKP